MVHRLDYTLSIDTHGAAGLTRFYWPDRKDRSTWTRYGQKALEAEMRDTRSGS